MAHREVKTRFAFFGTPEISVDVLERLKNRGLVPSLAITNPDRPQGRKMVLAPPPVKLWAGRSGIPVLQPERLDAAFAAQLKTFNPQLAIVVAYGTIIPKSVLEIFLSGTLNLHYSLLPKYRGATPIETQILNDDRDAGVSVILLDEKMDHGPIVAQKEIHDSRFKIQEDEWPLKASELRKRCIEIGAELLCETIPLWSNGKIQTKEQEHEKATYTKKLTKADGEIDLAGDAYQNLLKIRAFDDTIGAYFHADRNGKKIRVRVKDAEWREGQLVITRVVPEGSWGMSYEEFLRGMR